MIIMEMRTLTKQVLNELIDHIDVYETQGTGKNKTQRLVIYYKFVGYLDIDPTQCHPNYTADIREGVAIEYVSCEPSDSLKELFSERDTTRMMILLRKKKWSRRKPAPDTKTYSSQFSL